MVELDKITFTVYGNPQAKMRQSSRTGYVSKLARLHTGDATSVRKATILAKMKDYMERVRAAFYDETQGKAHWGAPQIIAYGVKFFCRHELISRFNPQTGRRSGSLSAPTEDHDNLAKCVFDSLQRIRSPYIWLYDNDNQLKIVDYIYSASICPKCPQRNPGKKTCNDPESCVYARTEVMFRKVPDEEFDRITKEAFDKKLSPKELEKQKVMTGLRKS